MNYWLERSCWATGGKRREEDCLRFNPFISGDNFPG
jgi:hypothetical protein